ncbi:MAG: T9SS type A sorting domain-containing protein [Bacteroidota bacterium]
MKIILRIIILSFIVSFSPAVDAQPADQSFSPGDASYLISPFSYGGIVYTQAAPAPTPDFLGLSINYPPIFTIVNGDGSDAAMCYNFQSDGSAVAGPVDFRFKSEGQPFKLNSMEADASIGTGTTTLVTITGYVSGNPVAGAVAIIDFSLSTASGGGVSYTNNDLGGNGGNLTFNSNWQFLDEVRFTGTDLIFAIDDLDFSPAVILPVSLSRFTAQLNNGTVQLSWHTEMEAGSSHFTIERSSDGSHFLSIVRIQAKGNSDVPADYVFTDIDPGYGNNYYRLVQYDLDGNVEIEGVRLIIINQIQATKIFPNPVNAGQNFILTAGSVIAPGETYQVIDLQGKIIKRGFLQRQQTQSISTYGISRGIYMLKLSNEKTLRLLIR